jgi:hypothetical protein
MLRVRQLRRHVRVLLTYRLHRLSLPAVHSNA